MKGIHLDWALQKAVFRQRKAACGQEGKRRESGEGAVSSPQPGDMVGTLGEPEDPGDPGVRRLTVVLPWVQLLLLLPPWVSETEDCLMIFRYIYSHLSPSGGRVVRVGGEEEEKI